MTEIESLTVELRRLELRSASLLEKNEAKWSSLIDHLMTIEPDAESFDLSIPVGQIAVMGHIYPNLRDRLQQPDAVAWFRRWIEADLTKA